ncbi:fluoride efflux transporter CrcB [Ihubacter sp. mB4P-1]|uniref:fluoride efflux transporter CrcB n=1 Tax=Ihubacter sp. mB4P-1 TaxID=3242370 RepID=UPI003C7BF2A5
MFQKNIDFLVHLGMAALGGAVGATARYALGLIPVKTVFPWVTFFINLTGALLIGFVTGIIMGRKAINPNLVIFVKIGVCGGFTTFSTFSLEVLNLLEEDHLFTGILYAVASICTCLLGVWVGRRLAGYCI